MSRERWGAFSVSDHSNLANLVAEILLYDCLVIPTPDGDGEWQRWRFRWLATRIAASANRNAW
jgi:hypothetical protein